MAYLADLRRPFSGAALYIKQQVLTLPNAVTSIRFLCAIGLFATYTGSSLVFWHAFIGTLSDAVDGYIAKRFHLGTEFGKRYDQYVDWLFGVSLIYVIARDGGLFFSEWPFNTELLVLIGFYLVVRTGYPRLETTLLAKIKTAIQFCGGACIIAGLTWSSHVLVDVGYMAVWGSIALMFVTLVDYLWRHQH